METTVEIKVEDVDIYKETCEKEVMGPVAETVCSDKNGESDHVDEIESMDSCGSVETIEFVEPREDPVEGGSVNEVGKDNKVSEKKNACLPLLSSDEEGESADLHQCGHCKLMFSNLTKYITHKIQKVCWLDQRANNNHREELAWSPRHRVGSLSPDDTNGHKEDDNDTPTDQDGPDNINQSTEAEIRKHHNVYGQAGNSPRDDDDCKSPSAESVSTEDDKLNSDNNNNGDDKQRQEKNDEEQIENENEEKRDEGDEEILKDNNNGVDFTKKVSKDSLILNQSEIDLNSLNGSSRDHADQAASSPRHSFNGSPRNADIPNSHSSNSLNKYDRLTPNLPPIMSTRGSSRSIDNFYPVDKKYQDSRDYSNGRQSRPDEKPRGLDKIHRAVYDRRDDRYSYGRYEQPRYEAETESTWTSSYLDRKKTTSHPNSYKTSADYYSSRERLTTMVGLDKDYKRNGNNDEYEKSIKVEAIEKDSASNMPPELVDERTIATPPDLVRVEPSDAAENNMLHKKFTGETLKSEDNDESSRGTTGPDANLEDSLDDDGAERQKFMEVCSPDKESNSPLNSSAMPDLDDVGVKENLRETAESQLLAHHRLSESAVEQLITVPVSGTGDPSWKHAKQVYSCPLCAKVFPFKSKLQRHVLVHTRIKPYKCTVCGRGFTQQIDLQRHLTRHTGEKPFKCHLCTAQFIRADNLRKHCKDAHYVVIEEPIRKRRRRTTGSDTVLPSLEVAIALAFSETERNGGRVLGRTVTRANPRTPAGSTTTSENFNNQFSQKSSSDVAPFIGEHHTAMFSQSSSRYPGPPPDDVKGGPYEQRKTNEPYPPGGDDKEPFSPGRKSFLPREMPRLYENGHQGRGGYMPPPEYEREYRDRDRESQDYMLYRDKERRHVDPRGPPPPHMSAEQRYKMEYRPLSADVPAPPPRGMVYRRSGGDEKDYRRRYPDPRMEQDIEPRDKYSMYNHRTSGSARSPDPRGPYDHPSRRPVEMRESRSQLEDYESNYRYSKSYTRNDPSDPGEYVSMATDKDDEPKIRSSYGEDDIRQSAKNGEFIKSADLVSSQYAAEEEIPIVTRSDELPGSLDAT